MCWHWRKVKVQAIDWCEVQIETDFGFNIQLFYSFFTNFSLCIFMFLYLSFLYLNIFFFFFQTSRHFLFHFSRLKESSPVKDKKKREKCDFSTRRSENKSNSSSCFCVWRRPSALSLFMFLSLSAALCPGRGWGQAAFHALISPWRSMQE